MNTNINSEVEQAKKEVEAAQTRLAKAMKEKIEGEKGAVRGLLKSAIEVFSTLDDETRAGISADPDLKKILASFVVKGKKRSGKTGNAAQRSRVKAEDVLYFIKKGQTTVGEVDRNFEGQASKVTVGNRIKELLKGKKITETKAGTKKFLQAA
jgi:hypothetical protein